MPYVVTLEADEMNAGCLSSQRCHIQFTVLSIFTFGVLRIKLREHCTFWEILCSEQCSQALTMFCFACVCMRHNVCSLCEYEHACGGQRTTLFETVSLLYVLM